MADGEFTSGESLKDDLEEFFTSPNKGALPAILEADKEYNYLDFKREWHDRSKLAKHLLAFSNSGGGCIVYGVDEDEEGTLKSVGLNEPVDEAEFGDRVEKYLPDLLHNYYKLETYPYGQVYDESISGKTFQVIFIDGVGEKAPLIAENSGTHIDEGSIYVRRNTKSVEANYQEVQSILDNRLEKGVEKKTAEFHEELRELKILYSQVAEYKNPIEELTSQWGNFTTRTKNPTHPTLNYEEYIVKLINKKKQMIEKRLGVENIDM